MLQTLVNAEHQHQIFMIHRIHRCARSIRARVCVCVQRTVKLRDLIALHNYRRETSSARRT